MYKHTWVLVPLCNCHIFFFSKAINTKYPDHPTYEQIPYQEDYCLSRRHYIKEKHRSSINVTTISTIFLILITENHIFHEIVSPVRRTKHVFSISLIFHRVEDNKKILCQEPRNVTLQNMMFLWHWVSTNPFWIHSHQAPDQHLISGHNTHNNGRGLWSCRPGIFIFEALTLAR